MSFEFPIRSVDLNVRTYFIEDAPTRYADQPERVGGFTLTLDTTTLIELASACLDLALCKYDQPTHIVLQGREGRDYIICGEDEDEIA